MLSRSSRWSLALVLVGFLFGMPAAAQAACRPKLECTLQHVAIKNATMKGSFAQFKATLEACTMPDPNFCFEIEAATHGQAEPFRSLIPASGMEAELSALFEARSFGTFFTVTARSCHVIEDLDNCTPAVCTSLVFIMNDITEGRLELVEGDLANCGSAIFRVDCGQRITCPGAANPCGQTLDFQASLRTTRRSATGDCCLTTYDQVPLDCDELFELRLSPGGFDAVKGPRAPRPAVSVRSDCTKVVLADAACPADVLLIVDVIDRENGVTISSSQFDPLLEIDGPPCSSGVAPPCACDTE